MLVYSFELPLLSLPFPINSLHPFQVDLLYTASLHSLTAHLHPITFSSRVHGLRAELPSCKLYTLPGHLSQQCTRHRGSTKWMCSSKTSATIYYVPRARDLRLRKKFGLCSSSAQGRRKVRCVLYPSYLPKDIAGLLPMSPATISFY